MAAVFYIACRRPVTKFWIEKCPDYYLGTGYAVNYGICQKYLIVQQISMPADTSVFYTFSYPMHFSSGSFHSGSGSTFSDKQCLFCPSGNGRQKFLFDFGSGDGSYMKSVRSRVGRIAGFEFYPVKTERLKKRLGCDVYCCPEQTSRELVEQGAACLFGRKLNMLDPLRFVRFPVEQSLAQVMDNYSFVPAGKWCGTFPNTRAESLVTCLAGHYHHLLFTVFMPFAFLLAAVLPQGTSIDRFCKKPSQTAQQGRLAL